jgi:hypothetical protein
MDWVFGSSGRTPVCKPEALSSNPSPKGKKKQKQKTYFQDSTITSNLVKYSWFQEP